MVFDWLLASFILGYVSFLILVVVLFFFGKLILIQWGAKRKAKKGYYMVEHIEESGLRKFYFLKPKNEMYDLDDGLYQHEKECRTRTYELMSSWRFSQDAVTWRFGIPTLTYYGSDISPINYKEREKLYDAKQMKGYAMLLLMATRGEDFKRILNYLLLGAVVLIVILGVFGVIMKQQASSVEVCQANLNYTQSFLFGELDKVNQCVLLNSSSVRSVYLGGVRT